MVELQSTLTCPQCGGVSTETMPTDACQYFYDCRHCGSQLGGRYVGVRFIGGKAKRVWTCGCGHDRRLNLTAAA